MIRFFIAVLLIACSARADVVDNLVRANMKKQRIPGLSLAVVKDGKVTKAEGYGFANLEQKIPATPQTVYQLASVSKQFVAAGVMKLVEEGKIKLEDPVGAYLHNVPASWTNVTVRRLLSHTAGLKRDDPLGIFSAPTDKELLEAICTMPLDSQPGEKWFYSNAGYNLMSFALAERTHESWEKFLEQTVFEPLHMDATRRIPVTIPSTNFAVGYFTNRANGWRRTPVVRRTFASGGLVSTVLDLAKWDAALYGEQLLKRSSFDQIIAPIKLNDGESAKVKSGAGYGFGWSVGDLRGHKLMSHNGSRPGFSTYIIRFYEDKLTVIVLANEWKVDVSTLGRQIGLSYLPDEKRDEHRTSNFQRPTSNGTESSDAAIAK